MKHADIIDVRGLSLSAASSAAVERFDALIDDLYYLEGAPPYARLTLPPSPSALQGHRRPGRRWPMSGPRSRGTAS